MANEHTTGGAGATPGDDRRPPALTAAAVAAGKVSRGGLHADGDRFLWTEARPAEGGRPVVVADAAGGPPVDVTPAGIGVRSRVHEYGGGAAWTTPVGLVYVDQADQRLYRLEPADAPVPVPLTLPLPPDPSAWVRYADGSPTASGRWVVCVEERHAAGATSHQLVAVATDGSLRTVPLVEGTDFVAAPRVSPRGDRLAWVAWNHPSMSWDESELWVATLEESGPVPSVARRHRVAGGGGSSVGQPYWTRRGDLLYVDDRTGWWLPYRMVGDEVDRDDPRPDPLVALAAEFHAPDWVLGQRTLVEAPDGSVVCRMHRDGTDHLVRLVGPASGSGPWSPEPIPQPCVSIAGVAAAGDRLAVLGSTPTAASVVVEVGLDGGPGFRRLSAPTDGTGEPDPDAVSTGRPFVADTAAGPVPGLFYAPVGAAPGVAGPPPLVVFCHGGPTGATDPGYDPVVQFFTGRGLAVAAVDYRGSSGYGRTYRQALRGGWGVLDVEDCAAFAGALVDDGRVDGSRLAIRGTSAGGLTALGALVGSDRFAGAASWYGVTDLEALAADTHEFEARYLDGLVGPLPGALDEYRRRSPVHRAADIGGAVLLLQGADDPVVPLAQAEGFAAAIAATGGRCELVVFPEESHGFRRAGTIEACLEAEFGFYRWLFALGGDPWTS